MEGIVLDRIELDAIVGVTEAEQRATQPVVIDVELGLDLEASSSGDLTRSVDYASLHEQIRTFVQFGQWRLIETIGIGLARLLLAPPGAAERRGQIDRVVVTVRKPTILAGAVPGVRVERDEAWCELGTRMMPPRTWVDTLCEAGVTGAYRLHVEPGSDWEIPPGAAVQLVAGDARADGVAMAPLGRLARGQARILSALGTAPATLLVVTTPPLRG